MKLYDSGVYLVNGTELVADDAQAAAAIKSRTGREVAKAEAAQGTIAYGILKDHNVSGNMDKLQIKFDKLTSHDITFVGIIQTARASGLEKFPIPYVLTNCHNSLCAVGGTINEDDHMFGLTCAKRYGGIYVPPHQAVIHQFAREMLAAGGKMILGSDSHTRYGALGTMAVGEGGPELVKQLLSKTYDIDMPGVVGVYLTGTPRKGVGPQDIALAIIGEVFDTYWLIEYEDKLFIIDQHAAHEKVLYERTMARVRTQNFASQTLSPPLILTLSAEEQEMLTRYGEQIRLFGYEVEPFGGKEFAITAIPADFEAVDMKSMFLDMLDDFTNISGREAPELILEKVASMSCKAAIKGGDSISRAEAEQLIDELLSLENPYHCPHGRPTIISMSKYEIEKKFKRIV